MLNSIDAQAHMTVNPVTVSPDDDIFVAIQALLDRSISGATVVDGEGHVVGVLSEMDCLRGILSASYHGQAGGKVADFMTAKVDTVPAEMSVLDVAQKLVDGHRRRFPIVQNGKFVGQYSCRSMLKAVVQLLDKPRP